MDVTLRLVVETHYGLVEAGIREGVPLDETVGSCGRITIVEIEATKSIARRHHGDRRLADECAGGLLYEADRFCAGQEGSVSGVTDLEDEGIVLAQFILCQSIINRLRSIGESAGVTVALGIGEGDGVLGHTGRYYPPRGNSAEHAPMWCRRPGRGDSRPREHSSTRHLARTPPRSCSSSWPSNSQ